MLSTTCEILEGTSSEGNTSITSITDLSPATVSNLKVAQLKDEPSMRCLSTKGKKDELASQLLVAINGPDCHSLNGPDRLADSETDNESSGQKTKAQESSEVLTEKDKTRSKIMSIGKHDRSFDELSVGLGSIRTPEQHDHKNFLPSSTSWINSWTISGDSIRPSPKKEGK